MVRKKIAVRYSVEYLTISLTNRIITTDASVVYVVVDS